MHITLKPEEADALMRHSAMAQYMRYVTNGHFPPSRMPLRELCAIFASTEFLRGMAGRTLVVSLDVERLPQGSTEILRCESREEARKRQGWLKAATHARRVRLGQVGYHVFSYPSERDMVTLEVVSDDGTMSQVMVVSAATYKSAYAPEGFDAQVAQTLSQEIAIADLNAAMAVDVEV